ncbi:MerR family transcriptional regulator [Kineosporia babensis]|uniref:MerR family transcriptional regulator n=1 Tax=Kineosporia babensis TaxID=499548 RepID=A0A9X1NLR3_9ACTN|nr:MerR family transcriptional regulator [Kineosporia babensis]
MKISQLAEATGASPRALRYYEEVGLITASRLSNGYRDYDETAVQTVELIRSMLDSGLSSDIIKLILPCTGDAGPTGDCEGIGRQVLTLREELTSKLEQISLTRNKLDEYLQSEMGLVAKPSTTHKP